VGPIDAAKDTYEVLQKTLAGPLNVGLRQIVNQFACVYPGDAEGNDPIVTVAAERPENINNMCITLEIRAFVAGDLAFYATVLGKPNMSPCWCTWCMLSKVQWSASDHDAGAEWTIQKKFDI